MLEEARSPDRCFDVICVHSFSRFYRNGAEMALTIRQLRKHGVKVVSVTQPTGSDPAQELMRQIIGVFDEYTSRENGKNVSRAARRRCRRGQRTPVADNHYRKRLLVLSRRSVPLDGRDRL